MSLDAPDSVSRQAVEERLGFSFSKPELLVKALSHKSFSTSTDQHNEKLEFLGDAVLDLILAEMLMREFPNDDEGRLSKKRASLVNERVLAEVATELRLGEILRLGKSEILSNGERKPRLLASCFEALMGAVYLDGGLMPAKDLIERIFLPRISSGDAEMNFSQDYKTQFQEIIQAKSRVTPVYQVIEQRGPSHNRIFTVVVEVSGVTHAQGEGPSKKAAEQVAAKLALEKLEREGDQ